uniref:CxC3 like cysteine cluster domain-containing protein n=1 Tax=Clytia hemisphaerica TaxID=252671 RepID=A0A7M5U8G7_9CNID
MEDGLGLMQKILATNKALKARGKPKKTSKLCFVELKRSSETGQRIYKPKRQKRNTEHKKSRSNSTEFVNEELAGLDQQHFDADVNDSSMNDNICDDEPPTLNSISSWLETLMKYSKSKKKKKKSWFDRTQSCQQDWDMVREGIWRLMQAREVVNDVCALCCDRKCDVRCLDCLKSLCYVCDDVFHLSHPLHDRFSSAGRPIDVLECLDENKEITTTVRYPSLICSCSVCGSGNISKVPKDEYCIVITLKGRFDLHKYIIKCIDCDAQTDPFTIGVLLTSGFWPGNPKSLNYLFKEEVFQLWDNFRKFMPGSSERAFLKSLNAISDDNCRKATINPTNFSMAFREWCLWLDQKDLIQSKDWMECPACYPHPHSCHVDGNSKLYRYKRGLRQRESFYGGRFVIPNESVSKFIDRLYNDKSKKENSNSICGGVWSAAQNASRKMAKLDETGLEVATCRHVLAQKALNMFRGEVFGYPYFLIKECMIKNGTNFCFADVMCKLWPFIVRDDASIKTKIKPALSIMHAKGHSIDCQVVWSGEWLDGTGRSTGEETEQLFSYLSRFGNSTKYQLPEKREETLTEAVLHWNKTKVKKLVSDLAKRYYKNEENLKAIGKLPDEYSADLIIKWKEEIQEDASGLKKRVVRQLSDTEKLVLLVEKLHAPFNFHLAVNKMSFPKKIDYGKVYRLLEFDKSDQLRELDRLANKFTSEDLLEAHRSLSQEILLPLIKTMLEKSRIEKIMLNAQVGEKDTSKKRKTVRSKLATLKSKEGEMINDYLVLIGETNGSTKDQLEQGILPWLDDSSSSEAVKRRITVEKYLKKQRFLEEKKIIIHEMRNAIDFMEGKIKKLMQEYKETATNTGTASNQDTESTNLNPDILTIKSRQGEKVLKEQGAEYYRREFESAIRTFLPIIEPTGIHDFESLMDFGTESNDFDEKDIAMNSSDFEDDEEESDSEEYHLSRVEN